MSVLSPPVLYMDARFGFSRAAVSESSILATRALPLRWLLSGCPPAKLQKLHSSKRRDANTTVQWNLKTENPANVLARLSRRPRLDGRGILSKTHTTPFHNGKVNLSSNCEDNSKSLLRSFLCFSTLSEKPMQNGCKTNAKRMQNTRGGVHSHSRRPPLSGGFRPPRPNRSRLLQ